MIRDTNCRDMSLCMSGYTYTLRRFGLVPSEIDQIEIENFDIFSTQNQNLLCQGFKMGIFVGLSGVEWSPWPLEVSM